MKDRAGPVHGSDREPDGERLNGESQDDRQAPESSIQDTTASTAAAATTIQNPGGAAPSQPAATIQAISNTGRTARPPPRGFGRTWLLRALGRS